MSFLKQIVILFSLNCILLTSGAQDSYKREIPGFHGLNIMGKMRVELYRSDTFRVEFSALNMNEANLITEVKDSILNIRLKTDTNKGAVVKVLVFYSSLVEITVASNALLVSPETLVAEQANFTARTGAKMELNLDVKTIKAEVKQGAILVFEGKTNKQNVSVNTGATYSAYKLEANDTYVTASSGSKAKVCAARIIDASSNTKSYIGYIGVPVSVFMKTNLGGVIASFANADAVFEE